MSDEKPEDERAEEARVADAWSDEPTEDPEAPEADALEQAQAVGEDDGYEP